MDARTEPGQVTSPSHNQARPIVFCMLLEEKPLQTGVEPADE
jgi:hypothetical protein